MIIYRSVKGSNLTPPEVDGNFSDLDGRLTTVEGALPAAARGIETIELLGSSLVFTFTDATTVTLPLTIPEPVNRGDWQPDTFYYLNDFFTANGQVYRVLEDHTSAATFDPGASDTAGSLYGLWLSIPPSALPTGGAARMAVVKNSAADYDYIVDFIAFSELSDVDVGSTDLASGDVPKFDGLNWVNGRVDFSELTGTLDAAQIPPPTGGTAAALGGVFASDAVAHQFLTGIDEDGNVLRAQPAFSDVSGTVADAQLLQIKKQSVSSSGGALSINRASGEIVECILHENITSIAVTNWPTSGYFGRVVITFINPAAYTVTGYPSNTAADTLWIDGTQPTVTVATTSDTGRDRVMLSTEDAGATVTGDVIGQGYE